MKAEQLYPVVRVSYEDNDSGTGAVVASKKNDDDEYETYVLTRYEWIDDAIEIEERFDSMIGEERKMETRSQVSVEIPTFKKKLDIAGTRTLKADILSYDEEKDLAVLLLDDISEYDRTSRIASEPSESLDEIRTVGTVQRFSVPFHKRGEIVAKGIREGDQTFDLVRASKSLFVAGAVVLDEHSGEVKGVLSGEDAKIEEGKGTFGTKLMIPLETIHDWLDGEFLSYIYDDSTDMEEEKKEREEYKKKETRRRIAQSGLDS